MKPTVFLVLVLFTSLTEAQDTLVLSGIKGSVNTDISLRVLKEAYKQLGMRIEYRALPGERALRSANSGETDGEVFRIANIQKRYTNLIPVPTPINQLEGIAFTLKADQLFSNWESLRTHHVGIQVGIKFAERGTKDFNRTLVDTNEQLFKLLHSGRVDVVVAALANGLQTLHSLRMNGVHAARDPLQIYPLYHYLHKQHASLVPKLDKVLRKMVQTGRVKQVRFEELDRLRPAQALLGR